MRIFASSKYRREPRYTSKSSKAFERLGYLLSPLFKPFLKETAENGSFGPAGLFSLKRIHASRDTPSPESEIVDA